MDPLVFILVLAAAVLHASWNAIVKSGGDPWVRLAIATAANVIGAACLVPFVPFPNAEAWPFIIGSVVVHQAYFVFVSLQYSFGDLSHTYPIARGIAPLTVAIGAYVFAGETLSPVGMIAVVVICAAIISLSLGARWRIVDGRAVAFALCTGATIALYTVVDGLGGRAADDVFGYIVYLFLIEGIPFSILVMVMRRGQLAAAGRAHWRKGALGGVLSFAAYGMVIWAMTSTEMTYVSALRETSVIIAALIGTRLLHEPLGARRIAAAAAVAGGVILLQMSNGNW